MSAPDKVADKVAAGASDYVHTVANEPSLGLYYVMEHIQRSVPTVVGLKRELTRAGDELHGADLDAAFAQEQMRAAVSEDTHSTLARAAALAAAAQTRAARKNAAP